ncbi:hypothetical protein K440DRAFT_25293 [Wilcoxina mikolae CBS 423.85]|nr:hypothetical protein K440DRAFT_25293 [Wilcoxina mikolae CBS 423.85]
MNTATNADASASSVFQTISIQTNLINEVYTTLMEYVSTQTYLDDNVKGSLLSDLALETELEVAATATATATGTAAAHTAAAPAAIHSQSGSGGGNGEGRLACIVGGVVAGVVAFVAAL